LFLFLLLFSLGQQKGKGKKKRGKDWWGWRGGRKKNQLTPKKSFESIFFKRSINPKIPPKRIIYFLIKFA